MKDKSMNRENIKNSLLTVAVMSAALTAFSYPTNARADDLVNMDDSFLGEPVNAAPQPAAEQNQPAEQAAPAPEQQPAPVVEQNNPFAELEQNNPPPPAPASSDPFADVGASLPQSNEPALDLSPAASQPAAPAPAPARQMSLSTAPNEQFLGKLSSDVFREMAEIEQENNTLMLQLKRDKLRSEIDALKTSNRQNLFNEIERREKMTQARLEWELEQELKRQAAVERKQMAEIRQKQIEAALKREEERRIQREKEEEMARLKAEEEKKAAEKKLMEEEKKKQDANSMTLVRNKIKPNLQAVVRPPKPQRAPSEESMMRKANFGESLLALKKAGKDVSEFVPADITAQDLKADEQEKDTPIKELYIIRGINGTDGHLVVKLVAIEDEKVLYQSMGNELPSGHKITKIARDGITVKKGKAKEEFLPYTGAGFARSASSESAGTTNANSMNSLGIASN